MRGGKTDELPESRLREYKENVKKKVKVERVSTPGNGTGDIQERHREVVGVGANIFGSEH